MIKEVIVVEGRHDEVRLKEVYPNIECISTNGSALSNDVLETLVELSKSRQLILFLDPDSAGERIRRIISKHIPSAKHAFITLEEGISKNRKKVGIEHASKTVIEKSLNLTYDTNTSASDVTQAFLIDMGLINQQNSREKRLLLCNELRIGYVNSKGLLKRLHMFSISKKTVLEALSEK